MGSRKRIGQRLKRKSRERNPASTSYPWDLILWCCLLPPEQVLLQKSITFLTCLAEVTFFFSVNSLCLCNINTLPSPHIPLPPLPPPPHLGDSKIKKLSTPWKQKFIITFLSQYSTHNSKHSSLDIWTGHGALIFSSANLWSLLLWQVTKSKYLPWFRTELNVQMNMHTSPLPYIFIYIFIYKQQLLLERTITASK